MESAGFMNALTIAATAAPVVRKRKRVSSAAKVVCVHYIKCLEISCFSFCEIFVLLLTFQVSMYGVNAFLYTPN